jgi:hypothetical protein
MVQSHPGSKRFKKGWLILGFICLGIIFFHKPLVLMGCKAALYRMAPKGGTISYEEMQWNEGVITISGLHVKELETELTIDKIELELGGSFLHFQPKVIVTHPQILMISTNSQSLPTLPFLYRTRFIQPHWEIKNGVLQLPSGGRFYFTMLPGIEEESIGHLTFSSDPNPSVQPMLSASLALIEGALQVGFKLQESDLSRLLSLTGLIFQTVPRDWKRAAGEIELEGLVYLNSALELQELHCHGEGKQIVLIGVEGGIDLQCEEIGGTFSYPLGDELNASLFIKNGNCLIKSPLLNEEFGARELNGTLKESELVLHGILFQQDREISFACQGKGEIRQDTTFWSELELNSISPNAQMVQTTLSLCSQTRGEISLHLQIDNADFEHLNFGAALSGIPGHCFEGTATVAATLFYQNGNWQKGFVENCHLENLHWFFPSTQTTLTAHQVLADCEFVKNPGQKWSIEGLHFQCEGGDYSDPELHLDTLSMQLMIEDQVLQPSLIKGKWEDLQSEIAFLGLDGDHFADVKIQGDGKRVVERLSGKQMLEPLPIDLQIAANIDHRSRLTLQTIGSISNAPIQGSAIFSTSYFSLSELIAGNLPSLKLKEGKFQAESMTEKNYDAWAASFFPGLKLSGDLQWEATFLPATTQMRVTGKKGFIQHPLIDLSFENLNGSLMFEGEDFKGSFSGLTFPINDATVITEGQCDLKFNSKEEHLTIEKGEGVWRLIDGTPYTVQIKRFSLYGIHPALDFEVKVIDGKREFAHFEGKAAKLSPSQWEVAFDKRATVVGGIDLNITRCLLDEQMKLTSFEMRPTLRCQELHTQAAFLQNAGFLSKAFSTENLQEWQFEGTLQTCLFSESADKGFSLHAQSGDLRVRGKPWASFQLKAHKIGENWLIEHLEGGGLTLRGAFIVEGTELSFHQLEGNWQGIELKGSGNLKADQKQFSCQFKSVKGDLNGLAPFPLKGSFIADMSISGDFSSERDPLQLTGETNLLIDLKAPLILTANPKKAIKFTYNNANGLICDGIDLQIKDKLSGKPFAELSTEKLLWPDAGNLALEKLQFSLSPALIKRCIDAKILHPSLQQVKWEDHLEGNGTLQLSSETVFQATIKPGRYGFRDQDLPFEQLQVRYEKGSLLFRGKTQVGEKPLWAALQIDLAKQPYGALKLFDHPKSEGLKILFTTLNGKVVWESVQGSCHGIDCQLTKNNKQKIPLAILLSGRVKLDGNSLCSLLPKDVRDELEPLKMGKGYEWQGDLILWQETKRGFQMNGILKGNEFEAFGYQFRHLQGNLEVTPEHIFINDLKIDDPAGIIAIKKIELSKNGKWTLYIPQIFAQHWQPSLMYKIGIDQQVTKPFTIENFILSEIRGELGKKSSLEGSGHLTFANQYKKESSLLDIPFEMIKKIGLDPGLLTPVQGKLEMELCGDKFYLLSLQNSFSEGSRAEFYLAPGKELSYIDLDGKIHIDLKMHQDVMLKITEPFTLTIRGTLEKPRYGLQY